MFVWLKIVTNRSKKYWEKAFLFMVFAESGCVIM